MNRRTKGSLTVEATIILPVFIALMLFISYFIKIHYVHDRIQDALSESVSELCTQSYFYYLSGLPEIKTQLGESVKRRAEIFKSSESSLQTILETLMGEKGKVSESLFKSLIIAGGNKAFAWGESKAFEEVIRKEMGETLGGRDQNILGALESLGIEGGLDGFDFKGTTVLDGNNLVSVQVHYKISRADPFGWIKDVPMKNQVVARAWMGGDAGGSLGKKGGSSETAAEENINEEETRTCYILPDAEQSTKYHFYDCPNLREKGNSQRYRRVQTLPVVFVNNDQGWNPKDTTTQVNGKAYQLCGNCQKGLIRMNDGKTPAGAGLKGGREP